MNKIHYELSREDFRDCILITKSGDEFSVSVDILNCSPDTLVSFEGCINRALPYWSGIHRCLTTGLPVSKLIGAPEIKNVIFNDPATIVFWEDGTKTVVKCQDGDEFDPEKGLAMAIAKKAYGNKGNYCNKMKKWLPKEEPIDISQKPKNRMTFREEEAKKHPENINAFCKGGVLGCPRDKEGNCTVSMADKNCRACWNRVIPDELLDND